MDKSVPLNQCPDLLRFSQCLPIIAMEHSWPYGSQHFFYFDGRFLFILPLFQTYFVLGVDILSLYFWVIENIFELDGENFLLPEI